MTEKIEGYSKEIELSECKKHNWRANFDAECPHCEECEVCKGACQGH